MTSRADDPTAAVHTALRAVVNAYFNGLEHKDLSQIPWHPDVTLRTPLAPGGADMPIRGDENVRDFFNAIAPLVSHVTITEVYFADNGKSVAAQAEISIAQPMHPTSRRPLRCRQGQQHSRPAFTSIPDPLSPSPRHETTRTASCSGSMGRS